MFDFSIRFIFEKMGQPPPLFRFIFGLFKQTLQFLQQINVKKCRVHLVYSVRI